MGDTEGIVNGGKFFKNPAVIYANEKDVYEEISTEGSEIVEFFRGKSILLTGGTGFFGKIIMEKLMRVCPDVDSIFVLCREKKGKDMHTRLDEIFNDNLFERLAKINPKFRHKITAIKGDISLPGLGLSIEDRQMIISRVQVILHSAATVRFDEPLRRAYAINIAGAMEMINLGRECKNLVSFVHISTAYANCNRKVIDEEFYTTRITQKDLEKLIESKTDEELEKLTPSILGPWPNTYTFTKAITETVIKEISKGLPLVVIRPSIVVSTYKEPVRGWIDNLYGPTGVVLGAGMGILRTLHCDSDNVADIVPVDMVVNAILASAFKIAKDKPKNIPIYNYVSAPQTPITWGEFMHYNQYYGIQIPTKDFFWYYNFTLNKYKFVHLIYGLFLHFIPALIIDGICTVIGKKPQLMKIYKKINKFTDVIGYFSTRYWVFSNANVQKMWHTLSDVDQRVFPFNIEDISWDYHSQMNIMGMRTYLIRDDPSTIPKLRVKWNKLRHIDNALRYIFIFIGLRILYGVLTSLLALFF